MNKILYANGCSWTFGNGIQADPSLKDTDPGEIWRYEQGKNWAAVLSDKLKREYRNDAEGGGSNKRIIRTTCDYLQTLPEEKYKDLLVIIGWTSIDRDEIFLEENNYSQWCLYNARQPVSSHLPPFSKTYLEEIDNLQKQYTTHVFNYKANYTYFFQQIYLMSNLLENLGIKYLFFNSLPWTWECFTSGADIKAEFSTVLNKIKKPNILNTRDCHVSLNVMSEFCRINRLPMAPDHHTMIEGHAAWANHLHKELIDIYGNTL